MRGPALRFVVCARALTNRTGQVKVKSRYDTNAVRRGHPPTPLDPTDRLDVIDLRCVRVFDRLGAVKGRRFGSKYRPNSLVLPIHTLLIDRRASSCLEWL